MISHDFRTQRGVTGPMNFKKSGGFFIGKFCTRNFGAPVCHPSTLIDLSNTAMAGNCSVETICMISESYRAHRGFTGPMNFKKSVRFFFGKSCSRDFGAPACHPSTLVDLANTVMASNNSVKTKCMISEGYRTNRDVTGPMKFKKPGRFFSESRAPEILGP